MSWFTLILPILTLVLGAVGSFVADSIRYRRGRRDLLTDTLRAERSGVYIAFMDACHEAAHKLGRMAPGCPNPLPSDPDTYWLIDSEVTRRLRNLQIVGGVDVIERAQATRSALLAFRSAVQSGAAYESDEYRAAYLPAAACRDAFIDATREELSAVVRG